MPQHTPEQNGTSASRDAAAVRGPRELFARFQSNVLGGGVSHTEDMCDEDIVVEMPFLPEAMPRRVAGRTPFLAFLTAGRAGLPVEYVEFRDVVIHDTTDPEVIIAEYELVGKLTTTGAELVTTFAVMLRAREGRIVHWREYQNVSAMAEAFGGLPDVTT